MPPQIIFGTASFGMDMTEFQDVESVKNLLTTLRELGIRRLDSGARYPPLNPGRSEELIGEAREISRDFVVDTKVYTNTANDGSGDLEREAMRRSVAGSLQRLRRPEGVNVLHAHRADPATPLEEQIRNFNEQVELGYCKGWGLSNTPPSVVLEIVDLCEKNGWRKPVCYQGEYSMISRGMEDRLLPILRAHGIAFNAFRSLASGFLTGKFVNNEHSGTRFSDDNPIGKAMRAVFGSEDLRQAVKGFDAKVRAQGLTPIEVAIRWVAHHSALGDNDGIVIGASKTTQLVDTVAFVRKGPLPEAVLTLADELWDAVKGTRGEII
ncbi:putative oxidoreductase [Biscogniauxia sp. FL1348]|nr:putative oxidoreductase [Biscogniauxia sp. FL1348]